MALLSVLLWAANPLFADSGFTRFAFRAIGTEISVTHSGSNSAEIETLARRFFEQLENEASLYRSDSRLSVLNKAKPNEKISIGPVLFGLLKAGIRLTRETEGKFDITYKAPAIDAIRLACSKDAESGVAWVTRSGVMIDLNGIAAGFAADEIGKMLRSRGMRNFLVDAGGEILACGTHGAQSWKIGIEDPRPGHKSLKTLESAGSKCHAVSTSGDYQRFIVKNGEKLSFIVDPKTGKSVKDARLVTVVAGTAHEADALSTGLSVGLNDRKFIQRMKKKFKIRVFALRGDDFVLKEY